MESEEIEEVLDEDVVLEKMDPVELKRYVSAIQSELRNISDFRWEHVKKL